MGFRACRSGGSDGRLLRCGRRDGGLLSRRWTRSRGRCGFLRWGLDGGLHRCWWAGVGLQRRWWAGVGYWLCSCGALAGSRPVHSGRRGSRRASSAAGWAAATPSAPAPASASTSSTASDSTESGTRLSSSHPIPCPRRSGGGGWRRGSHVLAGDE